jgi:hypothetical protein
METKFGRIFSVVVMVCAMFLKQTSDMIIFIAI